VAVEELTDEPGGGCRSQAPNINPKGGDMQATSGTYLDLYTLPVPEANLEAYREQASAFGAIAREHGALSYRELVLDDPGDGLTPEPGIVFTAAVVEFRDRAHRDEVMAAVLADPRVEGMTPEPVADMSRMTYGGFAPLVTL
jgi:uncharacterized protein YbaA (DUF1428 family)